MTLVVMPALLHVTVTSHIIMNGGRGGSNVNVNNHIAQTELDLYNSENLMLF